MTFDAKLTVENDFDAEVSSETFDVTLNNDHVFGVEMNAESFDAALDTEPLLMDVEMGETTVIKIGDVTVKVEETEEGAEITVDDATGTQSATIYNGKDGAPGKDGDPGKDGAQGPKGDKGDPGEQGIQGEKGEKGEKGDKGDTGAPGKDGASGEKGDTGEPGEKGADGAPGKDGVTPTIGDNGNWYIGDTDTGKPSRGEPGTDGATPNFQIGTVTTLDAGSDATASITGTAAEPVLNLGIPRGSDGNAAQLLQVVYPVGSIYLSAAAVNPATLFGFGTWVQIKDTFLLAAGDTYAAGTSGGEATHKLTVNELPDHKHYIAAVSSGLYDIPAWTMQLNKGTYTSSGVAQEDIGCGYSVGVVADPVGLAHNNMPPYLAVYVWQRTA